MKKTKAAAKAALFYLLLAAFVVIIMLPFLWQFLTSIKPLNEISAMPAKWIPSEINVQYYINIFTKHPFARYMLNSAIVAISATVLSLLIGASAAYALARLRFRFKKPLLMFILCISMFPTIATLSPIYLLLRSLKLLNTYQGLVLPYRLFSFQAIG